jgi:hypothetical protein
MASQQIPVSAVNATEPGLDKNERSLTSDESMTFGEEPSEEKEGEIGVSPTIPTSSVDDYPDGGLAAWCVVFGVSQLTISSSFEVDR